MDPEEMLREYDFAIKAASEINNNDVVLRTARNDKYLIGHKTAGRFTLVTQLSIGPRGGLQTFVCLIDRNIKPVVDGVRVTSSPSVFLPPIRREPGLDIELVLKEIRFHLETLPSNEQFYEQHFSRIEDHSIRSVKGLQGGAPGLSR